jgi:hypothetical protein
MIEEIDQHLSNWITSVCSKDIEVSLRPPGTMGDKKVVGLYLKDILPSVPHHGNRRLPLQVLLRYLITSWAESPQEAHQVLGKLLFAAMEHPGFEVELAPIPTEVWNAFGIIPVPAFMLCLPLRVERPEKTDQLIRLPIEISKSGLASMGGMVMGPGKIPLTNARVELSTHNLVVRTDVKGRFLFPAVPTQPSRKKLCITARGQKLFKEVEFTKVKQESWIIDFDVLEV